jgi:plastocyanin
MSMHHRRLILVAAIIVSLSSGARFDARPSDIAGSQRPEAAPIAFNDNGQLSAAPDGAVVVTGGTYEVKVGANGFTFTPSTLNITISDTVHWTWVGFGHTVTSGVDNAGICTADSMFCDTNDTNCATAPALSPPSTYSHIFNRVGTFPYFCRIHCGFGMVGTINVAPAVEAVTFDVGGFALTGRTTPSTSVTILSTSSLTTQFQNPTPVAANSAGTFMFTDPAPSGAVRFYRATFP